MEDHFGDLDVAEVKIEPYDECIRDNEFTFVKEGQFENEDTVSYIEIETNSVEDDKEKIFEESTEISCIPFDVKIENISISKFTKVNQYA